MSDCNRGWAPWTAGWLIATLAAVIQAPAAAPAQSPPHSFYSLNADGTGWRKLFQLAGHPACGSPAVSPDGKEFAFDAWQIDGNQQSGPAKLFVVGLDGTHARELCSGQMPSWSADGKFLVCSRSVEPSGLWIVTAEGKDHKPVAPAWGAQWSPDGKRIAYYSGLKILTYEVATGETRQVVSGADRGYRQIFWNMTWSPDSSQICFKAAKPDGTEEIALVDAGGEQFGFKVRWSGKGLAADFAWHPRGDRLVMPMRPPDSKRLQLFEFDPDADDPPVLVAGQDENLDHHGMCWTPDGEQLIVVSSPAP